MKLVNFWQWKVCSLDFRGSKPNIQERRINETIQTKQYSILLSPSKLCIWQWYFSSAICCIPNVLQAQVSFVTLPIPKCAAGTNIPRHLANYKMCCRHKYLSSPCQFANVLHAQVFLVNLPITTKQYGGRNPIWDVRMMHHLHIDIAYLKLIHTVNDFFTAMA